LGPGLRLIKKEFTGSRSHEGSETLHYSAMNIHNKTTKFYCGGYCVLLKIILLPFPYKQS